MNKTKRTILAALMLIIGHQVTLNAQQVDYTQYYVNLPMVNPGFTGIDDFLDVKAGMRQGWNDFSDKNSTAFISGFGPLNQPLKAITRNNALRVSDPSIYNKMQSNKKLRRKHGLGGVVSNRTIGPYQLTTASLNYAYHLPISRKFNWSFGTKIGYEFQKVDFTNYTVRDEVNDVFYQNLVSSNEGRRSSLTVDFGTVLYSDKFYFGVSTNNIVVKDISNDNILDDNMLTRYRAQVGKMFSLSNNMNLSLGASTLVTDGYDPVWNVTTRVKYRDFVYIGASYEYETRYSLLFGLISEGKYGIHYSYDDYISGLSNFNVNSHEVVLSVFVFNKYKMSSKFW